MPKTIARPQRKKTGASTLIVRLDKKSKSLLKKAAELRGISVSDFVRIVTIEQARREVEGAKSNVIVMTPDEQLAFWNAINETPVLTESQKRLGAMMRGRGMTSLFIPDGYRLERLSREHPRKQFSCGETRVDDWLWAKALQNQEKHLSATKVLIDDAGAIACFYTLAMSEVEFDEAPEDVRKRLPRRRLPVALLAWMGVSASHQGQGLGARIFSIALRDCYEAGKTFAFVALIIDCISDASLAFFRKWDCTALDNHPNRLFLSAKRIEAMMGATT